MLSESRIYKTKVVQIWDRAGAHPLTESATAILSKRWSLDKLTLICVGKDVSMSLELKGADWKAVKSSGFSLLRCL